MPRAPPPKPPKSAPLAPPKAAPKRAAPKPAPKAHSTPKTAAPMAEHPHPADYNPLIEELIKSNMTLQDKMADVLLGVKELNNSVGNLINLFSEATEHIKTGKYEDPLVEKLNDLLEQNKNLAKGLLLLEDYIRKKQQPQFKHPTAEF